MRIDARIVLYLLAEEFGLKRGTMEDRIALQKTVYLLQTFGLQLGYGFNWYKYGPYSQDLVTDAYRVMQAERGKYAQKTKGLDFSEGSKERFARFREIEQEIKGIESAKLREVDQLELVASVDFVWRTWYSELNDKEFIGHFKTHKMRLFGGQAVTDPLVAKAIAVVEKMRKA